MFPLIYFILSRSTLLRSKEWQVGHLRPSVTSSPSLQTSPTILWSATSACMAQCTSTQPSVCLAVCSCITACLKLRIALSMRSKITLRTRSTSSRRKSPRRTSSTEKMRSQVIQSSTISRRTCERGSMENCSSFPLAFFLAGLNCIRSTRMLLTGAAFEVHEHLALRSPLSAQLMSEQKKFFRQAFLIEYFFSNLNTSS